MKFKTELPLENPVPVLPPNLDPSVYPTTPEVPHHPIVPFPVKAFVNQAGTLPQPQYNRWIFQKSIPLIGKDGVQISEVTYRALFPVGRFPQTYSTSCLTPLDIQIKRRIDVMKEQYIKNFCL